VKTATFGASLALAVSLSLSAQDTSSLPSFEAASIKENKGPMTGLSDSSGPGRFSRRYITLAQLLIYAYEVAEFQIEGGPDWVRTRHFDVQATAEGTPSADQTRLMVQRLLAERFNLMTHVETRDMPRYALVMARSDKGLGPKLQRSAFDCPAIVKARGPGYRPPAGPPQPGEAPRCGLRFLMGGGSMTIMVEGQPMTAFAKTLQAHAGRVVIDKTGLTGTYDIELETEIQSVPGVPDDAFGKPREGLSLSTALPEQLGLKLESERGPVEVLVIDRVEPPTPN
jgi:uncharacterized protein (TIGR03435 family)